MADENAAADAVGRGNGKRSRALRSDMAEDTGDMSDTTGEVRPGSRSRADERDTGTEVEVAIDDESILGATKGGGTDADTGIDVGGLTDAEPETDCTDVEDETVDGVVHAGKDKCFVEVAYTAESVGLLGRVSRS